MSFLYAAALAVALLVLGPVVAHLLRRRRTEEQAFAPARLVPPSPPVARKRRNVDDRALFAIRTLAVLALAVLGATPFVRCSGLALGRSGGASVAIAIVLDDSLSMQVQAGGSTRFERAKKAARDLLSGAREGDAVALVLAGAPARVALASTTDLPAARAALDGLRPEHRATDLDGAIALGRALLRALPQVDKRVVALSDLCDGHPGDAAIGEADEIPVWVPLEELRAPAKDCAVVRADRQHDRVTVEVACSPADAGAGRFVELTGPDKKVHGRAPIPDASTPAQIAIDTSGAPAELSASLTGGDAIAADDAAPVLATASALAIAVVADPATSRVVTGGPPPAEQALAAIHAEVAVKPLPMIPDHAEDLAPYAALLIDDPPGFTPETRRSLATWLEHGGVALLALGPHAASAPLGASFDPILPGSVAWGPSPSAGVDPAAASILFGPAAAGLAELAPRGRAGIDLAPLGEAARTALRWKDGAPWLVERPVGRGMAFVLTLPLSTGESDVALRPAFLALLDTFVEAAHARSGAHRTDVGQAWAFEGAHTLEVRGPDDEKLRVSEEPTRKVATPDRLGTYRLELDGEKLLRVAAVPEREVDLRPRRVAPAATRTSLGEIRAKIDASPYVAVFLLALVVAELALRLWVRKTPQDAPR